MKNSTDFDKLSQYIQTETAQTLPESLSPEAIAKSLEAVRVKPKKRHTARYASLAAAIALVVLAAAVGLRLTQVPKSDSVLSAPKSSQNTPTVQEAEDEYLRTADYAEIENFFLEKQKAYRAKYLAGEMEFFKFNSSYKDAAPESSVSGSGVNNSGVMPGTSSADDSGARAHGETNTQVAGVEESDILKNDGNYLYIVRHTQNAVEIVDIRDPKQLQLTSTVRPADETRTAEELYVYGDRMVVLYRAFPADANGEGRIDMQRACYAYGAEGAQSVAEVYDISDRTAPRLCFDYAVDGTTVSSRLDGGNLLLVTSYNVPIYKNADDMKNACVPCTYQAGEKVRFPAESIRIVSGADSTEYLTVSRLDIRTDTAEPQTKAVLGGGSDIYCDGESLLIAQTDYTEFNKEDADRTEVARIAAGNTRLYAFRLQDGIAYTGSAQIAGTTLNQFSMDSFGGYYRIATTADDGSLITVLDANLRPVGELRGIAKGESIYAARFAGDTAYLVTFYQTDPLFVIDLSDPAAPKTAGELKIPGFSNYLHPYSDTLLIGVGQDGSAAGANGHLKISLFDVSDRQHPQEISKAVYSDSDATMSAAQNTHKAFLTVQESGEFAVPVQETSYRTSAFCCYASMLTVQDGKLQITGTYTPHTDGGEVTRVTYAGDTVFTLSEYTLTAFDKATGALISELSCVRDSVGSVTVE